MGGTWKKWDCVRGWENQPTFPFIFSMDFLFLGLNMIKLGKEKGKNVQEIDFLLINWTHQYILNIEVKKWLGVVKGKPGDTDKCSISKAKNQINTIKTMIEDWFGADLKGKVVEGLGTI